MNKLNITLFTLLGIVLLSVVSCDNSSNPTAQQLSAYDACSCATVQDMNSDDYKKCKELRADPKFESDYQKCKLAKSSGIEDTSRITIQKAADATNLEPAQNGDYTIDNSTSVLRWYGKKITRKKHSGNINVKNGTISIVDGKITGGQITLDMATIVDTDLSGESKIKLENHLKSEDFFNVAKYGEANFTITSATQKSVYEFDVVGKLTIKGITQDATCQLVVAPNGNNINIGGGMTFDRSKFDVRYGSDTFFDNLGNDAIDNEVVLVFDLKGKK